MQLKVKTLPCAKKVPSLVYYNPSAAEARAAIRGKSGTANSDVTHDKQSTVIVPFEMASGRNPRTSVHGSARQWTTRHWCLVVVRRRTCVLTSGECGRQSTVVNCLSLWDTRYLLSQSTPRQLAATFYDVLSRGRRAISSLAVHRMKTYTLHLQFCRRSPKSCSPSLSVSVH